jgi:hypothetical protein
MVLCYELFLGFFLLLLILVLLHIAQKFEETLKLMLNMESTKECMNILLLTDAVFQLCEMSFLNGKGATSLMDSDMYQHVFQNRLENLPLVA